MTAQAPQPAPDFAGRRVVVMGLGRFGGGVGVTRFLAERGADILITDLDPPDKLNKSIAQVQDLIDAGVVTLRLGGHNVSDFTTCDLVVVNPAVKPGNRFVRAAEAAGIEVTTEMRLLVQRLPNRLRTIGVTGSAGKSTVTAMIGHVLGKVFGAAPQRAGPGRSPTPSRQDARTPRVWVGGNLGGSLLPHIDEIGGDDWVVLELSSFMLERLRQDAHFPGWSPHIAVVTNISPNHLDWHGSMQAYVAAKQVIASFQTQADWLVTGPGVVDQAWPNLEMSDRWAGVESIENLPIALPGRHNQLNAWMAAYTIHRVFPGTATIDAWDAVADFPGLPHRLQLVAEHGGVRYYNDSKCTTPEAATLAIQAFAEEKGVGSRFHRNDSRPLFLHLVLGGHDKGSDLKPLAAFAAEQCKAVYTIGATGDAVADAVAGHLRALEPRPGSCGGVGWPAQHAEVVRCGDLDTAMGQIARRVKPGDVVLLSPACASWDQFENYEQRGARFVELVRRLTGAT